MKTVKTKVAVHISGSLGKALREYCQQHGLIMYRLIECIIEQYLAEHGRD